jgi:hypothetical protein
VRIRKNVVTVVMRGNRRERCNGSMRQNKVLVTRHVTL